jgi:hypothetical protein
MDFEVAPKQGSVAFLQRGPGAMARAGTADERRRPAPAASAAAVPLPRTRCAMR